MGILELLAQLIQFIRELIWPLFIVAEPKKAIRYTNGKAVDYELVLLDFWKWHYVLKMPYVLGPGLYFAAPFFQEIRVTNCAENYIDVANLSLTLIDGKSGTFSYNMGYVVEDILKYQTKLHQEGLSKDEAPQAIHSMGSVEVSAHITSYTWPDLVSNLAQLEARIERSLARRLATWGIKLTTGGITICAQALPLAIIHVD